ncbi:hypothetical protein GIB67_012033 [Kingdonia uniflora]|uniref:Uncharacterized protein n=1 Tax=Kingdonia uniflora TaxID=39325 RepID=A0A7J7M0E7_9MAGN|nr:hypothetical protein GIB67_012033 [Kingdonia uniflora]
MLRRGLTSIPTRSGEVEEGVKKRRVEPSELIGAKVADNRPGEEDELKIVEEKVRLPTHNGEEEMRKMAAHLMKGIYLRVEEEKAELVKGKAELDNKVARLKANLAKEGKQLEALKASQKVEINELTAETRKMYGRW